MTSPPKPLRRNIACFAEGLLILISGFGTIAVAIYIPFVLSTELLDLTQRQAILLALLPLFYIQLAREKP